MKAKRAHWHMAQMEKSIIGIGAKIADALEIVQKAKGAAMDTETMLIKAQVELEELYVRFGSKAHSDA